MDLNATQTAGQTKCTCVCHVQNTECSKSNKYCQTKASDGLPRIIQEITGSLTGSREILIYVLGLIYVLSPRIITCSLSLSLHIRPQSQPFNAGTVSQTLPQHWHRKRAQECSFINYLGPYLLCANQQSFRDFTGFAFHNATENECLTAANSTQRRFPLPY